MRHLQACMIAVAITSIVLSRAVMAAENTDASPAADITAAPAQSETATETITASTTELPPAAASSARLLHLVGTLGYSLGGDTVARITFSNGHEEKITAGGLMYVAAGLGVDIPQTNWSVQATAGYHFNNRTASNGDLTFDRNTLDEQVFYRFGNGNHRIGGGFVQHSSPRFTAHIDGLPDQNATFKNAHGYSIEYNWFPGSISVPFKDGRVGFSLRAVSIDYAAKSVNGLPAQPKTLSGSHVAVGAYVYL